MIILQNGDRWIYDDVEYKEISYANSITNPDLIPLHTYREFVERIYQGWNADEYIIPRKFTDFCGGYWDCNFGIEEIFDGVAVESKVNPWSEVYVMGWGHVYVLYDEAGHYETLLKIARFDSVTDYMDAVSFK